MNAPQARRAPSARLDAHRIGNVYYPRFGFGAGRPGACGLDEMLTEIREAVESIGRDSHFIGEDNRVLARLCDDGARKVAAVTSTIDGVAFETNLLALNTAIEASRCGAGGSEVSLVASEILELVRKSATATREMRSLLHDNVRKAEAGFRLVDEVGATMADIVTAVRQVTEILSEMSRGDEPEDATSADDPIPA